jgi:hypothetical protein
MSHELKGEIEIKDLVAFAKAIEELGGRFHKDKTTYMMYKGAQPCNHAASWSGVNYEIGLKAEADKTFSPVWDTYGYDSSPLHDGHKLVEKCGVNMGRLKQSYGLAVAEKAAKRKGHNTRRKQKADGTIQLVIGA